MESKTLFLKNKKKMPLSSNAVVISSTITLSLLKINSADDGLIYLIFFHKIGFDTCLLETICMKCQSLFSEENEKIVSKSPLIFLPCMLSIKG